MSAFPAFRPEVLPQWLPPTLHQQYVSLMMRRVGMTRRRTECFIRLWLYLFLKDCQTRRALPKPPLTGLAFPQGWVECSCSEAAELFYGDQERGGDRSAGMMLDKLAALGLIKKQFDGNCTQIEIQPLPELLKWDDLDAPAIVKPDVFDPRCDAIPIANLLASNYNWLNRNTDTLPYRIANILRDWASQYAAGMRVLRRCDNQNPVGFYALYPTRRASEVRFFAPPSQGLHLSQVAEADPFEMALPGDEECRSVFVRSWMIDSTYQKQAQTSLLEDAQQTLEQMKQDFPNLWDMYTLIIHPSYAELARVLGFQKTSSDPKLPLYWMYQAVDRFQQLDMRQILM
ncbi:hypothetical protein [Pseudanabaena sp. FACHB-2040]|uniref:hypothetical protein n=1 Tax=Pseudanabaena sp. FACHB-2040 TaxID=2692859 RepID=UPI001F54B161|nr:hypothetical protein [Pseudanabaena sp. FACHB-2040]